MNRTRIAILAVALVAGGLAALLAGFRAPAPQERIVVKDVPTEGVLVLARNVEPGSSIQQGDLQWAEWPRANVPTEFIRRSESPKALEEFVGAVSRGQFLAGEPVRRERIVHMQRSGFMAAMLPQGMRAVAIPIDQNGGSTAGGFILPNDRVDVITTTRDAGADGLDARTILTSIRVLAIGQVVQERNGERVVTGGTATLEVDPAQAELLILAQRSGQLSLVLRSIADGPVARNSNDPEPKPTDGGVTVVRYGVATSGRR
jgi:pilus assembly protein CpaB